jgi:hypothetical protein
MGRRRVAVGWGNRRERDHWGYLGVDGRIILSWIFRKCDVRAGLVWANSGYRQVVSTYECGNELSGSIKCGEFLD